MLELVGSQIRVLRTGLLSAFVRPDALDVFLREDLDKHLNFYAGAEDPFPVAAFKLIEGAQSEGWIGELVTKAYKARPRNQNIADIAKSIGVEIDARELDPSGPIKHEPPLWQSLNPYRGLLALREQDANFLLGRDEDIARFITTLAENPSKLFLALGASGVGKSSLIFAGVFSALDRQSLRAGKPWPAQLSQSRIWPRLMLTPGPEPLRSLAGAFLHQWLDPKEAKFRKETNSWRELLLKGDSVDGLIEALDAFLLKEKKDKPSRYLLYVDQGEELYTRGGREPGQDNTRKETPLQKEARRFSELLADAARHPRLVAIMSARSDFLGRLQADAPLHAVKQQIDIAPLSPEGLSEVVRRPAETLEVVFESGLDEALIEATREQAGALPLLSDTLDILWQEMQARGDGVLRWSRPLKEGVDVAMKLVERADGFVKAHQQKEAVIRRLFCVRLAYVPLQGAATRRTAFLEELTEPERTLVAELAGANQRIVVTGEREGKATAEVAHEALFSAWQTLRDWIGSRRAFYAWVTQIDSERQDYEKQGVLLSGRPLERAKAFLETDSEDVPGAAHDFIEASIRADNWRKRIRVWSVSAGVVVLAAVAGVLYLLWADAKFQRDAALRARADVDAQRRMVELALKEANLANSKRLTQVAMAMSETYPKRSLQIGLHAACLLAGDLEQFDTSSPTYKALLNAARKLNAVSKNAGRSDNRLPLYDIAWSNGGGLAIAYPGAVEILYPDAGNINGAPKIFQASQPFSIDWHHDRTLALATPDGVFVIDVASNERTRINAVSPDGQPRSVSWNPDGQRLAVGYSQGPIVLYTLKSVDNRPPEWEEAPPRIQWEKLHKQGDAVLALDWGRGKNVIAAGSSNGSAGLFNASTNGLGNIMESFPRGACPVSEQVCQIFSVKLSPDGSYLATGSMDGTATVANSQDPRVRFKLQGGSNGSNRELRAVTGVAWNSDGRYLATATGNGVVRIWNLRQRDYIAEFKVEGGGETRVAWDPAGGARIATASRDGTARTWTWEEFVTPRALLSFVQTYVRKKLEGSNDELSSQELMDLGIARPNGCQ